MTLTGVAASLSDLTRLRGAVKDLRLTGLRSPLSLRAGSHLAAHKGRGLEFAEVRHYQAGDDVRSIDWRVTARRGKAHTKLFREEKERPICVLADLHPGMFFGTRSRFKSVQVCQLAAMAAWTAVQNGDRIGGVVIGAEQYMVLPPKPRHGGAMALLHALARLQPRKPGEIKSGRLDAGLAKLRSLVRPGSLVVLLSDFRELTEAGERELRALCRHNDLLAGFIYDRLESLPPRQGRFTFASLHRHLRLETGIPAVRRQWQESFQRHHDHLHELGRKNNFPVLDVPTEMEPAQVFRQGVARLRKR